MVRHLVMGGLMGLAVIGQVASANVKPLDNSELAATVLPGQQELLQPTVPQHNSSGQIGGVEAGNLTLPNNAAMTAGMAAMPPSPSVANTGNNQMTLTLPINPAIAEMTMRPMYIQR